MAAAACRRQGPSARCRARAGPGTAQPPRWCPPRGAHPPSGSATHPVAPPARSVRTMRPRSVVKLARAGSLPARLRSLRDGQAAIRVATVGAALESGVLDALIEPRTTAALADTLAVTD